MVTPELLARAREGDEHAINQILCKCVDRVRLAAIRHAGKLSREEAVSDGNLAVLDAIRDYRPGALSFESYAYRRARLAILTETRNRQRREDQDGRAAYSLLRDGPGDPADHASRNEEVQRVLAVLAVWKRTVTRRRYADVLELFYGLTPDGPLSCAQIGERLGVKPQRVHLTLSRAVKWMGYALIPKRQQLRSNECSY